MEDIIQFGSPHTSTGLKKIIKVVGVGGGGGNAVNHMYSKGIKDVTFAVCNTDVQALYMSPVPTKIQLGRGTSEEGEGAGADPEKGRMAAEENIKDIEQLFSDGTKMVFITAGMGGGTGTGAAPVVARVAKEKGLLTIGIVTAPFAFEGPTKLEQAEKGIQKMRENCDAVLVILNSQIQAMYPKSDVKESFAKADDVLLVAAKSIAELITAPGKVNIDFKDVERVLKNSGTAIMGEATVAGEDRAMKAAKEALSSPLLSYRNIKGAKFIIISISYSNEKVLLTEELATICEWVQEEAGKKANVIWGTIEDDTLGEAIKVVITASGFDNQVAAPANEEKINFVVVNPTEEATNSSYFPSTESPVTFASVDSQLEEVPVTANHYFTSPPFNEPKKEESYLQHQLYSSQPERFIPNTVRNKPKDEEMAYFEQQLKKQKENKILSAKERLIQEREAREKNPDAYIIKYNNEIISALEKESALKRTNTKLKPIVHSSEQTSSYFYSDGKRIIGANSYLHNNVD